MVQISEDVPRFARNNSGGTRNLSPGALGPRLAAFICAPLSPLQTPRSKMPARGAALYLAQASLTDLRFHLGHKRQDQHESQRMKQAGDQERQRITVIVRE